MRHLKSISAHELDLWANTTDARARLPELIRRLVHATIEPSQIEHINFPGGEETQRPGYDGETKVTTGNAKVPTGITYWEMGANVGVKGKFASDYSKRLAKRPPGDYSQVAYVAITPRDYQQSGDWVAETGARNEWREVRVYDSNDLEQWLEMAPSVALWARPYISKGQASGLQDLSTHWDNLQSRLKRKLPAELLLVGREAAKAAFEKWLDGSGSELAVCGQTLQEVVDFFTAWVQSLPTQEQDAVASRAIIVEAPDAWPLLADSRHRLILVCAERRRLEPDKIAEALRKGHHVLRPVSTLGAQARGVVRLDRLDRGELAKRLVAIGLSEQDSYQLAQRSGGSFSILKRHFSSVPVDEAPAWGTGQAAAALAPLLLIGAWRDENPADQAIVAELAGCPYPETRRAANHWQQQPDAPLRWANGVWEFESLIDSWTFLHGALSPTQLDLWEKVTKSVLGVDDPRLDLDPDARWQANVLGKKLDHSAQLRDALVRSLAMVGTRDWPNLITDTTPLQARVDRVVCAILPLAWISTGANSPNASGRMDRSLVRLGMPVTPRSSL